MSNSHQRKKLFKLGKKVVQETPPEHKSNSSTNFASSGPRVDGSWESFAGGVVVTIAALLITKTPLDVFACLVLMYFCFLYAVFSFTARKFPKRSVSISFFAIPAVLIIVGAFGWWVWPHEVALTYTNAPEFNLFRKSRIQVAADSYSRFLKGVGFNVPMAAPVLGVSSGRVQAGLLPGLDTFRMTIAREDLDHPDNDLMATYGFYIVSREIHESSSAGNDPDRKERISDAIWLFANYYRCSFNGKLTDYYRSSPSIEKWNNALWELRAKYGAEAMDKAMFYATQQWKPFGSIEGDVNFDNYFSLRILAGIKDLDNNAEDPGKDAQSFLEQEGLYTTNVRK
jgi:hypothetical protein